MGSNRFTGVGGKKQGTLLALLPGLVLASASGCHKADAQGDGGIDAEVVGAANPEGDMVAGAEVAPPEPVVAADPDIPLNEAVVGTAPIPPDYSADIAPPEPVFEDEPPRPEPDDAWVPGYWWWSRPLGRYVWVSGAWRRPPPDEVWFPGSWTLADGRYFWAPGYWGPHGHGRVMIDIAPPALRIEPLGVAPGIGFVWTPGYYGYSGGSYTWIGGSWVRPPSPGVGWVEPRYVRVGGRYSFQPGRWDFAPERRGVVYRPDIEARAGAHIRLAPVPQTLVSAHANFVAASAHAIARGATRMPSGGYMIHPGGGGPSRGNEPRAGIEGHGAGVPGPGEPRTTGEPRGAGEPHGANEPPGRGGPSGGEEPHRGGPVQGGGAPIERNDPRAEPHESPAQRGGSEPHVAPAPRANPEHEEMRRGPAPGPMPQRGAPPVEHTNAAPAHEQRPPERGKR
jgi:hypothetical protein